MGKIKLAILKWIIQWHLVHSQCCTTTISFHTSKTFFHSERKLQTHWAVTLHFLPSPSLWKASICFLDLTLLDTSYIWSYTVCDLLCLAASFTQHNVFVFHHSYSKYEVFILFHGQIIVHGMDMPHLFIYSPMDLRIIFGCCE